MHRSTRSRTPTLIPPLVTSRVPRPKSSKSRKFDSVEEDVESTDSVDNPLGEFVEVNQGAISPYLSPTSSDLGQNPDLGGVGTFRIPGSAFAPSMATGGTVPGGGGPPPPPHPINPLVQPRGLPIVVPAGLVATAIPPNLPLFRGTKNEDPSMHVEQFIELLNTCLITDNRYYLVWFPTTLKDGAYEWYRNHNANTFATWDDLQRAFLDEYRPQVDQSAALTAVASFRQGKDEDITSYIRRFELVVSRYVGNFLADDTLKHFFIQGFAKESTIREILNTRPQTLDAAKRAARIVDEVDKEHNRIWRKEGQYIPSFIPIYARDKQEGEGHWLYGPGHPPLAIDPQPLSVRPPAPLPAITYQPDWRQEMKKEIENSQEQLHQQMRAMTNQMALLLRNQNPNPPPPQIESGRHESGIWCSGCGQNGHSLQFCPNRQQHQQLQPYQPPHRNEQGDRGQGSRWPMCHSCGRRHPPHDCWVENRVVCDNCGGNHPTPRCRRGDKVIPMPPLKGNFAQQAIDNQRGARNMPNNNNLNPPSMYYDHHNQRQNQQPPQGLQTKQGFIPYNEGQNRSHQDARYASTSQTISQESVVNSEFGPQSGPPSVNSSQAHFISHEPVIAHQVAHLSLPSNAVLTRARRALEPVEEPESSERSEGSPHFSELDDVIHKVKKSTKKANEAAPPTPPVIIKFSSSDDDEEEPPQEVPLTSTWQGPSIPEGDKIRDSEVAPPAFKPYDLWADLHNMKANISIAQLLQLAPSATKVLKKEIPMARKLKRRPQVAARVSIFHRPTSKACEVKAVEIEATIVDKVLPKVLVDGGSGVNIMPLHTMEQLGLQITEPSPYVINMANQTPEAPVGQITGCKMSTGGEVYTMTFQVLKMHTNKNSFSLLLGRPWLRASNAMVNWGGDKPHIIYGPEANPTRVYIQPCFPTMISKFESSSSDEDQIPRMTKKSIKGVKFASPEVQMKETPAPLTCLGPGLYEWEDDGEFTTWLADHPTSEPEALMDAFFMGEISYEAREDINLAVLVDDIRCEDVYGVTLDGTQLSDLEPFLDEEALVAPLHFKSTSSGIYVGEDLPIYPPIPNDWYKGPTEQPHVNPKDWQELDVSFDGEEPRLIKVGVQLSSEELESYRALVKEYRDIFAWSYKEMKGIPPDVVQHRIPLVPGALPIRQKERRMNPQLQLLVKAELEKLLQAGFIKPVEITDWVSPMVIVKKKNGKLRVCIDYRKLNQSTQKDHFPLPFINTILEEVAGHELYTFMDGYSGYNQISIHPDDYHKTAFTTPWGTFIYVVMPFGLCNAPSAFQRAMTHAFSDLLHTSMTVFIDDFSTQSSRVSHLACVRESFERCRKARIALNPDKIFLAVQRGVLLGYVVSKDGREPDPEKVRVITELPPPTDVKGIQRTLGHVGWYRELILDYATISLPISRLQQKAVKFEWTPECQQAFDTLKTKLSTYPVLKPPNWGLPFHVYCDASAVAVGSALCQPCGDEGRDYPIAFASRQLNPAERNYTTTERECLAMVFSVKKFRHYLLLNKVVFFVDHMAIKYLVNKADLSGRLARWVLLLEEFDYKVLHKPGKKHLRADHLSRLEGEPSTIAIDDSLVDENLFLVSSTPIWYQNIAEFLKTQKLPDTLNKHDRRKVRINSRHFALIGERLYRRGVDQVLRRCVEPSEIPAILSACHDSACGGHFSGTLTGQKVLQAGYYWPTLFRDCHDYVKRCDACQRYARNDLHMQLPLHVSLPLVPFEKWGIDYIGEIHPHSSRGMKHIIVATEYLTKWAKAKAVKDNNEKNAAIFLFEQVIARFGCPKILVSDRGQHFLGKVVAEITHRFQIDHRKTTPYHPQTNGNTERVNQTLATILRKTVLDSKRDWDSKLPAALWAYRTTYKVTTQATPFSLVYGVEAVLPIEFEVPSLRIAVDSRMTDKESLVRRLERLEKLDEDRRQSAQHIEVIQRRRKMVFDKYHKKRRLLPGMLVMLQDARKLDFPGKFDALWLGPYRVTEVFPTNAVQLETLDGQLFPTRTSGSRCKEYKI